MTLRLLVAEDSKTMQRVLEIALSQHDIALMMAQHRDDAVAALSRHAFDAAIVDADLPEADGGYGLARALKEASAQELPVVLLTSQENPFDLGRAQMAGVTGHVHKPFTTQALLAAVHAATGTGEAARDPAAAPNVAAPESPEPNHMAAIDEALAALGRDADDSATPPPQASHAPRPAFIRLESDAPGEEFPRHKPKPFFEEESTGSRALMGALSPVTVVRRPSAALREQSRVDAPLPSVDALPSLPSWDAAPPLPELPSPSAPPAPLAPATTPTPHVSQSGAAHAAPAPPGTSPAEELVALFSRGPTSADTPHLNALLAQTLERQLAQILWQVVPNVVTEEVRRYVQQHGVAASDAHTPPPPPPSMAPHAGH